MSTDNPMIDDGMVTRALEAMTCPMRDFGGRRVSYLPTPETARAILVAALTVPPPPAPAPEIEISDYVAHAGWKALLKLGFQFPSQRDGQMAARDVYRAMERERLKAAAAEPAAQPAPASDEFRHRRVGDMTVGGVPITFRHDRTGRTCQRPPVTICGRVYRLHGRAGDGAPYDVAHRRKGDV